MWGIEFIGIIGYLIYSGTFAYTLPLQISFPVGSEEIHEVKYVHKSAVGETRIFVDGEVLLKSDRSWHEPRKEDFRFNVGNNELHQVKIERISSRLGNIWSGSIFYISVDETELSYEKVKLTQK